MECCHTWFLAVAPTEVILRSTILWSQLHITWRESFQDLAPASAWGCKNHACSFHSTFQTMHSASHWQMNTGPIRAEKSKGCRSWKGWPWSQVTNSQCSTTNLALNYSWLFPCGLFYSETFYYFTPVNISIYLCKCVVLEGSQWSRVHSADHGHLAPWVSVWLLAHGIRRYSFSLEWFSYAPHLHAHKKHSRLKEWVHEWINT